MTALTNSLGNLTLMLGKWNKEASNKTFKEKKNKYKKSEICITKNLSSYDKWTPKNIENRQKEFFNICSKLWDVSGI